MKKNSGFTLIELLIVLGIIGIIAAIVGSACHGSDSEITHDPNRQVVLPEPEPDQLDQLDQRTDLPR